MKTFLLGLLIMLIGTLTVSCSNEEKSKDAEELLTPKTAQSVISTSETQITRLIDLHSIVYALEEYKLEHNAYPISSGQGSGWDGLYSSYGESRADWIQGIVPNFLPALPRDPRMNTSTSEQYLYKSNGANYKLLAHSPDDCHEVLKVFPVLVDPVRKCWAYGYWTPRAASW